MDLSSVLLSHRNVESAKRDKYVAARKGMVVAEEEVSHIAWVTGLPKGLGETTPKILHNHCIQLLQGITVGNGYAKFGGGGREGCVNKVHYGTWKMLNARTNFQILI